MAPEIRHTATGTGVGKTLTSAILMLGLDGCYWKPVQSGAGEGTDTDAVRAMTGASRRAVFCQKPMCFRRRCRPIARPSWKGAVICPGHSPSASWRNVR